ncbi:MAG: AbrB/MazE/SpoVT family DNA-binding domain-containing protein [Candidatus Pacearchaeota archaeon]
MIEIKTKLRKWGNSYGIIVPQKKVEDIKIKEGDEVIILLKKEEEENVLKEMFGTFKFKKSTDKIMREIDKELWDL